ncbi:hypothetical protein K8I61_17220 [bacterium]|nr:hypothetical protein [bacterium]
MSWQPFNAESLFPGPTKSALQATGAVAETVGSNAEAIAGGIETVSDFLYDVTDPARAAIQALVKKLRDTLTDILGTGVYLYYDATGFPFYATRAFDAKQLARMMDIDESERKRRVAYEKEAAAARARGEEPAPFKDAELPLSPGTAYGFAGWTRRWKASFEDQGDAQRPAFSDSASVSCLLLVAGTPSLDGLPALLKAIGTLLGIDAFKKILDRLAITQFARAGKAGDREIFVTTTDNFHEDDYVWIKRSAASADFYNDQFVTVKKIDRAKKSFALYDPLSADHAAGTPILLTGTGPATSRPARAPDWNAKKLGDLPPVRAVADEAKKIIGLLEVSDGMLALVQELADALKEKAKNLRDAAERIENLIERVEQILALTGVYVVRLDSATGAQGLFDALDAVEAGDDRLPLPPRSFVVGACLLAGGPEFAPVGELFGV